MIFHSQCENRPLELCFTGVRQYSIAGWEDNYRCEICECHMAIRTDLISGREAPLIVWADGYFAKRMHERNVLAEPMDTYVIAEKLKWRFIE